jgi:alpha-galactosidase
MNRGFSDIYSQSLPKEEQRGFFHRYVLGLYEVLGTITRKYPHILFESCSSGGSRFDMGMLYYMPQTWTSDNTDGIERLFIQYGTSFGYPLSTMGAHVSNIPNIQVLRQTPIETRFNTAMFGLLGYELDLTRLSSFDLSVIKKQISYYKEHRKLLQFGSFRRFQSPFSTNGCEWMVSDDSGSEAMVGTYQLMAKPNGEWERLQVMGLREDGTYRVRNRPQYHNLHVFGDLARHALPIRLKGHGQLFNLLSNHYLMSAEIDDFTVDGSSIAALGILPKQKFIGSGYNASVRLTGDFGSRVYHIQRIGELAQ